MGNTRSIFFDEWQACLRAHYTFVIQQSDAITESTLRTVLLQSGVSESELHALTENALNAAIPEAKPAAPPDSPPPRQTGQMSLF